MKRIKISRKYRDIRINYTKDKSIVFSLKSKYQSPFFMIIKEWYIIDDWYGYKEMDFAKTIFQIG